MDSIINYINNSDFEYIIVNKLNEVFKFTDKINKKIQVICHNPKDPFNDIILNNQQYIDTCYVLTNYHTNLLRYKNFIKPVKIYHNYAFKPEQMKNKPTKRTSFTNNICFIGRLAKEKNIELLIDSFNDFNTIKKDAKLYIIGDGLSYTSDNPNIIFTGRLNFKEICDYLKRCDYTISSSYIEGKPFSAIEGMSIGVPCIHSNIVGIDDIIIENQTGFLFNFEGYNEIKFEFNFDFFDKIKANNSINKKNLVNTLVSAYNIDMNQWNKMSEHCYRFSNKYFTQQYAITNNLKSIEHTERLYKNKKYKIFINFKPDHSIPYGGGNISVFYIVSEFTKRFSDFEVVYELEKDIDIYLLIDVNKDRKFKKFGIEPIVDHRNTINKHAKIIARINDCDITRTVTNITSREMKIKKYHNEINGYIYNSHFIKNYYLNKFEDLQFRQKNHCVIVNGCDQELFISKEKKINNKFKIVTHHWSPNLNKGYKTYLDIWKYCKKSPDFEFVFIGKHVPDMFKEVNIIGPYAKEELVNALNDCHIYITDSRYDSCPNHVLEAISCGLPILYSNVTGGARELCQMPQLPIGEMYNNFNDLLIKLEKIRKNYDVYVNNIKTTKHIFKTDHCVRSYYNYILKNCITDTDCHFANIKNKCIKIFNKEKRNKIIINDKIINLTIGWNIFLTNAYNSIKIEKSIYDISFDNFPLENKVENNDKLNILICSDKNYFYGVFTLLQSIISNTQSIHNFNFNFIIDINNCDYFSTMLKTLECKNNIILNKLVTYIDINILDKTILNSTCFNGGGHLLNIGNFSRLLIGEIFNYKKLIYLDSDSIVQYDLFNKCENLIIDLPIYAPTADKHSKNRGKNFVIRQKSIITCDYDWEKTIGININGEDYAHMGAPFIANCTLWNDIYKKIIDILKIHNNTHNGIFKLFTMSLQNIVFYKKTGNLNNILRCLQDLGSNRRNWDLNDLISHDILDWSGIFKPWYKNGLHKEIWEKYNSLNIRKDVDILSKKKTIENKMIQNNIQTVNKYKIVDDYLDFKDIGDAEEYLNNVNKTSNSNKCYTVLFVCDIKYLIHKMSRVRFWAIEELGRRENVHLELLGPGFQHFVTSKTLQDNIIAQQTHYDIVIWYKPMDENYNFCYDTKLPYKTMLRYNEMWDFEFTSDEIERTKTDIIICHHKNDYMKYALHYKHDISKTFYYNPHHANSDIFKPLHKKKEYDIMISGVCKQKHYPLKYKLLQILNKYKNTDLKDYRIYIHKHPGYRHNDSFKSLNQKRYNEIINKSILCLACTSRHNYRLGKYVEIPMSGSVVVGDIPFEDKENFNEFVIEVTMEDSDLDIIHKLKMALHDNNIEKKIQKGIEWSKKYTTKKYADRIIDIIDVNRKKKKIYIIGDEIKPSHPEFKGQKWICDLLKEEFIDLFPNYTTTNAKEADIVWYLAPWNKRHIPSGFSVKGWFEFLETKMVIMTQHHVDEEKLDQLEKQFEFMKKYGTKFHAICNKTKQQMQKYFDNSDIIDYKLWVNNNIFFNIDNEKIETIKWLFDINKDAYLVGSFQKDTEGKSNLPKLSKGPDLFVKIVEDMHKKNNKVEVVLAGLRRDYIMNELDKLGIKYYYFNMISIEQINKLYNCLDLYLVSSRCEGGPRSVLECGLTQTPIISTRVGIAPELMHKESLFDGEDWKSYALAKPNIEFLHNNVKHLTTYSHKKGFLKMLLN
jgi:glycosyltransferase involved in cell wall biosynthesis